MSKLRQAAVQCSDLRTGSGCCECVALSEDASYAVTGAGHGALVWRCHDTSGSTDLVTTLAGHRLRVTNIDFNRAQTHEREHNDFITCSEDRVILWSIRRILDKKVWKWIK